MMKKSHLNLNHFGQKDCSKMESTGQLTGYTMLIRSCLQLLPEISSDVTTNPSIRYRFMNFDICLHQSL